jgi:hypothetical protein
MNLHSARRDDDHALVVVGQQRPTDRALDNGTTYTPGSTEFALILDAKGANGQWIIYRLRNVSPSALKAQ